MIKEVLWLHWKKGRPSCQVMIKSIAHNSWLEFPAGLTPAVIDSVFHHIECTACVGHYCSDLLFLKHMMTVVMHDLPFLLSFFFRPKRQGSLFHLASLSCFLVRIRLYFPSSHNAIFLSAEAKYYFSETEKVFPNILGAKQDIIFWRPKK